MRSGGDWGSLDGGSEPTASAEMLDWIGSELRASYQALMDEPVPDRLLALIRQIDGAEEDEAD